MTPYPLSGQQGRLFLLHLIDKLRLIPAFPLFCKQRTLWIHLDSARCRPCDDVDLTLSKFYCSTPSLGINAQGIAAGAATADSAQNQTSGDEAWVFDKPFIFMLVDNETNIPVYISTVA